MQNIQKKEMTKKKLMMKVNGMMSGKMKHGRTGTISKDGMLLRQLLPPQVSPHLAALRP